MKYLSCILYGIIIGHFIVRTRRLLTVGTRTGQTWVVLGRLVEENADRVYEVGRTTHYDNACRAANDLDGGDWFVGEIYELGDELMPPVCPKEGLLFSSAHKEPL